MRHGLCAQAVVLYGEQSADFEQHRGSYVQTFQPANQAEMDLVETLAVTRWRLRRMPVLEVEVFVQVHDRTQHRMKDELGENPAFHSHLGWAFLEAAKGNSPLNLLQRYEGQLTRTYERSLKALQSLQKTRLAAPPQEMRNEPKLPTAPPTDTPQNCPEPPISPIGTACVSQPLDETPHPRADSEFPKAA
jgi:hypothetical protein